MYEKEKKRERDEKRKKKVLWSYNGASRTSCICNSCKSGFVSKGAESILTPPSLWRAVGNTPTHHVCRKAGYLGPGPQYIAFPPRSRSRPVWNHDRSCQRADTISPALLLALRRGDHGQGRLTILSTIRSVSEDGDERNDHRPDRQ